ncbi:LytTR family transcriptional regulator DNA-binding domain-containing protein [Saccharicrinis aurantiacus]|uniref:LytTR family transcriptional regulator DNA-binding domain-containing protein n=1 Tax=Saccharicrinis aurantiacus TaxID=1849719 RepID=UPI00094F92E3|nr:LytTR family transcriptional regulator DNA-binding domain-containing protein [Saccharicrinis aurantiacus]
MCGKHITEMKEDEKNGIITPKSVGNDFWKFFELDKDGKPVVVEYAINIKDKARFKHKIELLDILYIDLSGDNREELIIHLSKPIEIREGDMSKDVTWNKRLTGNELLKTLGSDFIRISDRYVVQKYSICSINADNNTLVVRDRFFKNNLNEYITQELKFGESYLPEIKKSGVFNLIRLDNIEAPRSENYYRVGRNAVTLNPIAIAYIESTENGKKVVLESFAQNGSEPEEIMWKTRWSLDRIMTELKIDTFIQVNKSFIVNLYTLINSPKLDMGKLRIRIKSFETIIPVGRKYQKEVFQCLKDN